MTVSRDPERLVRAFLSEGEEQLHDQVYDAVRAGIEHKRQRAFVGPWRTPILNNFVAVGLGAAAVVVVGVFVGAQLFGSPIGGGTGSGATPTPSATVAVPTSTPLPEGSLPDGPWLLLEQNGVHVSITIAAPGWGGEPGAGILTRDSSDPPDGAAMIASAGVLYVYGDPCRWSTTKPDAPATTVDEFVAAVSTQASRNATAPVDVTIGGFAGKSITLHVPDDAVISECDQGYFASWGTPGDDLGRYNQGPGQIDELFIADVKGVLTVIDAAYFEGTARDAIDEMRAMVDSITFD